MKKQFGSQEPNYFFIMYFAFDSGRIINKKNSTC